jgi:hypothetical protein
VDVRAYERGAAHDSYDDRTYRALGCADEGSCPVCRTRFRDSEDGQQLIVRFALAASNLLPEETLCCICSPTQARRSHIDGVAT